MSLFFNKSIKSQFGFATGVTVMLAVLFLSLLTAQQAWSLFRRQSDAALAQQTLQSLDTLRNFISVRKSNLDLWASEPLLNGVVKNASMRMVMIPSLRARFADVHEKEPWLENIFILDANEVIFDDSGSFEFSSEGLTAVRSASVGTPWVMDAAALGKATPHPVVLLKRGVVEGGNEGPWVVVMLDANKVHDALFGGVKIGSRGFVSFALDAPDAPRFLLPSQGDSESLSEFAGVSRSLRRLEELPQERAGLAILVKRLTETPMAVVGVASLADVFEPIRALIVKFAFFGVLVSGLGIGFAVWVASRLTHPIETLTASVRRLASGELSERAVVRSGNEVGVLAGSFNAMAGELQARIADVEFLESLSSELVGVRSLDELAAVVSARVSSHLGGTRVVLSAGESALAAEGFATLLRRPSTGEIFGSLQVALPATATAGRLRVVFDAIRENCELAIENICSLEESLKRVAIETEMKTAHAVQECLFTKNLPHVPGFDMHGFFTPTAHLGGDWYGVYFDEASKKLRLYVGDVTGHGVSSALITAGAMAVVHTIEADVRQGARTMDLHTMLQRLHNVILDVGRNQLLMTFCICELDVLTGEGFFVNAGHNPPFIVSGGPKPVRYCMAIGNRLGFQGDEEPVFSGKSFTLQKGETLALYTDGFIEACDAADTEFGIRRLQQILAREQDKSSKEMVEIAVGALDVFRGKVDLADDVSLLLCKRLAQG